MNEKKMKIIGIAAVLMLLCVACVGAASAGGTISLSNGEGVSGNWYEDLSYQVEHNTLSWTTDVNVELSYDATKKSAIIKQEQVVFPFLDIAYSNASVSIPNTVFKLQYRENTTSDWNDLINPIIVPNGSNYQARIVPGPMVAKNLNNNIGEYPKTHPI